MTLSSFVPLTVRTLSVFACLFLIGCSSFLSRPDPKDPVPVVESQPGEPRTVVLPTVLPGRIPPPPVPDPVAIVVGNSHSTFRELTDSLVARLARPYRIFKLEENTAVSLLDKLSTFKPASVVAIGQPALDVASQLKGADVIYAQVFNPPADHRGVTPIPPFDMQLTYWQQISPSRLQRIGVLGSASMQAVMDSLEKAASAKSIKVIRREVTSDMQTLQVFRAMVPYIDGFVFLPDETVLSPGVIRRMLAHGSRNNLQILTYSSFMYDLGAYLYISAEPKDVAEQIVSLIEDRDARIRNLTTMRIQVQTGTMSDEPS